MRAYCDAKLWQVNKNLRLKKKNLILIFKDVNDVTFSRHSSKLSWNATLVDAYFHGLFQNHLPQTLCDSHSPVTSSTRPGIPEHDASIYEQTVIKSTECIFPEVEGSKGPGPPVNLLTSTAGFIACNWGLLIDRGARLLFPFAYAAFIVTYFSFFHF